MEDPSQSCITYIRAQSQVLTLTVSRTLPVSLAALKPHLETFFLPRLSPYCSSNFLISFKEVMSSEILAVISSRAFEKCCAVSVRLSGCSYGCSPACAFARSFSPRTQFRAAATQRFLRSEPE